MNVQRKNSNRFLLLVVITLVLTLFFVVNSNQLFMTALVYTAIGAILLLIYSQGVIIPKKSSPVGIDRNWQLDIAIGVIGGVGFIGLNHLSNTYFSIGIPNIPFTVDTIGRWAFHIMIAPIVEEGFFRGVLSPFLEKGLNLPPMAATVIQAGAFSVYHYTAYGLGLAAAFVGAFVFGIVADLFVRKTKSLLSSSIMHGIVNGFLKVTKVVSVGG